MCGIGDQMSVQPDICRIVDSVELQPNLLIAFPRRTAKFGPVPLGFPEGVFR